MNVLLVLIGSSIHRRKRIQPSKNPRSLRLLRSLPLQQSNSLCKWSLHVRFSSQIRHRLDFATEVHVLSAAARCFVGSTSDFKDAPCGYFEAEILWR